MLNLVVRNKYVSSMRKNYSYKCVIVSYLFFPPKKLLFGIKEIT